MSAGQYDITIEQGATFTRVLTWNDVNNSPVNLTGYTAKLSIVDSNGNVVATLTSGSGITLGGNAGTITIAIAAAVTSTFKFDAAKYDLKLTDGSGVVTRLVKGTVSLDPEVTL